MGFFYNLLIPKLALRRKGVQRMALPVSFIVFIISFSFLLALLPANFCTRSQGLVVFEIGWNQVKNEI